MTANSPVAAALHKLEEAKGPYFIPKEVKEWLSDPDNGPVAYINPWKTKDAEWWVFTCPPGEAEILKDTLGIRVTHLFVSGRWQRGDMGREKLFNYHAGQFELRGGSCRWRYVNPDKAEREVYELTAWKEGNLLNQWHSSAERRTGAFWFH